MADPTFNDRMFLESERIYASIDRGEFTGPEQVEAALMDAHLAASDDES